MSVFYVKADGESAESQSNMAENMLQSEDNSPTEAQATLANFWPKVHEDITNIASDDFKHQALPLARIKKIMKLDGDVKMISAEAPILFAKAAEIFINELTLRAWTHTEDNKRRTLQRNDIAMAITMYDQFDFLIDIVPRDELKPSKPREESTGRILASDQVHYYVQLAQQQNQTQQQQTSTQATSSNTANNSNTVTVQNVAMASDAVQATSAQSATTLTPPPSSSNATASNPGIQIMQQIVTPSGELQHIPISLTQAQLNMIRMQMQNNSSQPIVIQAAPIQTSISNVSGQPQILQVGQNNATSVYLAPSSISESD